MSALGSYSPPTRDPNPLHCKARIQRLERVRLSRSSGTTLYLITEQTTLVATSVSPRRLRQPYQINRKSSQPFTMPYHQTGSRVRSALRYTSQLGAIQALNNSTHRNSQPHTDHRHHPDTQTHLLQSIFTIQASIHVQQVQHTPPVSTPEAPPTKVGE